MYVGFTEKNMLVTEKQNFTRGDKASASVRLRSKNKGASSTEAAKKKNRHSGDFSFFKHHHNNSVVSFFNNQCDHNFVKINGNLRRIEI